jgi:putative ABC transport system permease protein
MIALVLVMAWSRRGQAVTLALLAMFGVSAAVAAPAYLRAADRAVAAGQVRTAAPGETSVQIDENRRDHRQDDPSDPSLQREVSLDETNGTLLGLPGFDYVYAIEYPVIGLESVNLQPTRLVYRQDVCAHVVMVTGRCLVGESDLILGVGTAERRHVAAGDGISLADAVYAPGQPPEWVQGGAAKQFEVTGTYEVPDPDDPYWGTGHGYFDGGPSGHAGGPVFVTAASLQAMDKGITYLSIDGEAGPDALKVDNLPALRSKLAQLQVTVAQIGQPVTLTTGLPRLMSRIDDSRTAAHQMVPVLAVALVLLSCATIFLAVAYGTEGRRPELAAVALRGARWGQRWWLATGENVVAIVVGAIAGCIAGQVLVNAVAAIRFDGVGADPGVASLRYAPLALLAALVTAVLAERRQLLSPVAELLRRAPAVPREAAAIALAAAVALLAAVAAVQLRISDGTLTGVGTFAAGLIIVALAQVLARALLPIVTRFSRAALRRGRIGVALAGLQLSRRPGASRLFALLVVAVAIAGYAAAAIDVGARGRSIESQLGTGSARVLGVGAIGRQQLLTAVRGADPSGRYAMAVVKILTDRTEPAGLAVDSTRLAAVASWPGDGPTAEEAASLLRPPAGTPVTVTGAGFSLDLTATGLRPNKPVSLAAVLTSTTGLGDALVPLGDLRAGRHDYGVRVEVCRQGCRLDALRFSEGDGVLDVTGRLVLHGIDPAPPGVTRALDPQHWRATAGGTISAAPDGLQIDIASLNGLPTGLLVQPTDTPYPLPMLSAGLDRPRSVIGLDGRTLAADPVGSLSAIPGAGTPATMIDLEYADRLSIDADTTSLAQVWLSPSAPPGMVAALRARGLSIVSETSAAEVRRGLDDEGPALALIFYGLVGVLAVALGAGALILASVVDHDRRAEDLSALRAQGLSRRALRQAALWTYPALIAGAVVTGIGVTLLTWWLTGWALPLAGPHPPALPRPHWPDPLSIAGAGVIILVVLVVVAWLAGRRTLKEIR